MRRGGGSGPTARIILAALLPLAASCQPADQPAPAALAARDALHEAVALAARGASPEVASFYAARGHRPLWLDDRDLARAAAAMLADADADALDPARYDAERAARLIGSARTPVSLADLDVALSEGVTRYLHDLRTPSRAHALSWRDPALPPPATDARALLDRIAAAPDPAQALAEAQRMNPLYTALRTARPGDAEQERLRAANLDRLRALPVNLGERYVLVDAASAMLTMVEGGRAVDSMRVVVGRPDMATPTLAGLIRYATLNPYWNLPPDLSAERARRIMVEGPALLETQRLEVLSGWDDDAVPLDSTFVDWPALASGGSEMRLRQLPGPRNVMGAVKYMLPNPLGIYLHDTPDRWAFARDARRLSSGCVRLEDAQRFGAWLFGSALPAASGAPEERADLPKPVPVYIVYLTAVAENGQVMPRPDPYGRDTLN